MKATWFTSLLLSLLATGCLVGPLTIEEDDPATGGKPGSGGSQGEAGGSGGQASGGAGTGGSDESGGSPGTGGSATGGTVASGGASGGGASGGSPGGTGGEPPGAGGNGGTGGTNAGGTSSGGAATGGAGSGGDGSGGGSMQVLRRFDFESGVSGWYSWNSATVSVTESRAHSGTQSLLVRGNATGPAAFSLLGLASPGVTYFLSAWATVGSAATTSDLRLTVELVCGTAEPEYTTVDANDAVPNGVWVELSGTFSIDSIDPNCNVTKFQPYVEGDGLGVDLYVDDVSVSF